MIAAGCAADVDEDSRKVSELSTDEAVALCHQLAERFAVRTVHCATGDVEAGIPAAV